jgi:hypothetical protein
MRWNQRRIRLGVLAAALLVALVAMLPVTLTPGVRARLTGALGERFDSDVDIQALRVSVLPRLRVSGEGIVLRHRGRTDVPPLIGIGSFTAEASLFGLLGRPLRLTRVRLDGLEIHVPAGGMDIDNDNDEDARRAEADAGSASRSPLVVGQVVSERAVLHILRGEPGRRPRVFEIAHLSMEDAGSNDPWAFTATLTNPTPPGRIDAAGSFGPWNASVPSATRLDAEYTFHDADLGVFNGIGGILQSAGAFEGVLERIEVTGHADVPDFALENVGRAVPLTTRFHAVVDGTSGDTTLDPVDARLIDSPIVARGGVIEEAGEDGRTITLDVVMADARIEDVLRLAVSTPDPPMTGALHLRTRLVLPPGDADAIDKLRLDGSFEIATAQFTSGNVQAKVDELSQRAQGEPEEPPDRVASDLRGQFVMRDGVIQFSNVTFSVPSANISLDGRYTVRSKALDFQGTVRLDAKLSELTTGVKSFLLRIVDPLVRRKDVTVIPVTIGGTADKPDFGVDLGRAFTPGD